MNRSPTYLRVVATTACPLSCGYCHAEGDWQVDKERRGLDSGLLERCLSVAVDAGIRKFKFLGGEPLARRDLPRLVASLRQRAPSADLSVITSGVLGVAPAQALFEAGLDRMNLSIHGWTLDALSLRGGGAREHAQRQELLSWLVKQGRPVKLNYVYTGASDDTEVQALLDWAAVHPVVVNLLDDLNDQQASATGLAELLRRWRGDWQNAWEDDDPDSLPTTRLGFRDGLVVELKTSQLGLFSPWNACGTCAARSRCREGIFALRLTHTGRLQACMDRPDLSLPLSALVSEGEGVALAGWRAFVSDPRGAASPVGRHRLAVLKEARP